MKILQTEHHFSTVEGNPIIHDKLPINTFTVHQNPQTHQFYLTKNVNGFVIPSKLYGNVRELADKFIAKIELVDRLGIMLVGEKGTGKSITAKMICNETKLPVLIIEEYYKNQNQLKEFISTIEQKFILFIDEFEKIYDKDEKQFELLSMMDGTNNQKIIFLFTANSDNKITIFLKNRTSRIKYNIEFKSLSKELINEVIKDYQLSIEHSNIIFKICQIIGNVNYDVLIDIIKELLENPTYTASDLLYYLNIEQELVNYQITITNSKGWICRLFGYYEIFDEFSISAETWFDRNDKCIRNEEGGIERIYEEFNHSDFDYIIKQNQIEMVHKTKDYKFVCVRNDKIKFII